MENNQKKKYWKGFFIGFIIAFFIGNFISFLLMQKAYRYADKLEDEIAKEEQAAKEKPPEYTEQKDAPLTKEQTALLNEPIVQKNIEFYKKYNKIQKELSDLESKSNIIKLTHPKIERDPSIKENDVEDYDYKKNQEYLIINNDSIKKYYASKEIADKIKNLSDLGKPIYIEYKNISNENENENDATDHLISKIHSEDYALNIENKIKELKKEIVSLRNENTEKKLATDLEKFVFDYLNSTPQFRGVKYFKSNYDIDRQQYLEDTIETSILDYIDYKNYSLLTFYGVIERKYNDKMINLIHMSDAYYKEIHESKTSAKEN